MCSDSTPVHCNTVQGKLLSPLLNAALQDRLAAGLYHCNNPLADLLFIQVCSDATPKPCSTGHGRIASPHCSVLLCKTGSKQALTAITTMKICCSYRCAVTQHQCTALLFFAKCCAHSSVLLCKTGSQQALCHCNYTFTHLLFIQVCSDPTPMHCTTVLCKMLGHTAQCCSARQAHHRH